jgi:hypothetical protein
MKIEQFSKKEVALSQIETALDLFLSGGNLFSVITLAGAGEEILGRYLKAQGKKSAMDQGVEAFQAIYWELFRKNRNTKDAQKVLNEAKNQAKHMGPRGSKLAPEHEVVELDPHDSAVHMLTRAIENYYGLTGLLTENMQRFLREQYSSPPWGRSVTQGIEST